ncbi:MAG TPA: hypothetical protein VII98_09665 [Solirubrobacteraceae bacterium]
MRSRLLLLPAAVLTALVLAGPASAATVTTIPGAPAPGPAKYDKVTVAKYGPASAKKVLVLVPGTSGGAGDFTLVAKELVRRVPGLQVWTQDRREQALEDTSVFKKLLAHQATVQQALDYYLGWIGDSSITPHYQPLQNKDFGFAGDWGMKVALNDTRRVVLAARKGGRTVILGGHSLGASLAAAYAVWDFNGHPGYKDIAGIVAIDGGLLGSFDTDTVAAARQRLADLKTKGPFLDLLGLGLPWVSGPFAELGAIATLQAPHAPSTLQTFPLLPAAFKPDVPATNAGTFGYAFDESTSPAALSLIHVRAGELDRSVSPADWKDGEVTPIQNLAKTFGQEPQNAVDWYFPSRLGIDTNGANALKQNAVAKLLGLRLTHLKDVNIPYYAFQTSLTGAKNGVVNGAKNFAKASKVPRSGLKIVDAKATTSHLDPLTAAPATNQFLKTVEPWLKAIRTR